MIQNRPYQDQSMARVFSAWNQGHHHLEVLPTGGGKSVIVSGIAQMVMQSGMSQCVIAHRTELVTQMSGHLAKRGIDHRIIAPRNVVAATTAEHRRNHGRSFVNPSAKTSVGGVDTIRARKADLTDWAKSIDRWTIDEAHHVLTRNKWGEVSNMFSNALGLGVTATPKRADGMGLGAHHDGVFSSMGLGPTMRELIDSGYLCDYEIAVPESDFEIEDDAVTKGGDFSRNKMKTASQKSKIVGDVVQEYLKRAAGKRAIVFATDVETSNNMAMQFQAAGIPAASVSAKTPSDVRADMIRRFRDGRLTVLCNVDLFGEGFDVPAVEVVIMARPTASLGVYLQQFGRALRLMEGKLYGLIIDHVSNWKRHGFPDKHHAWSLDRRDKRAKREPDPEDIDLTYCAECSKPYELYHSACPHCGHVPEIAEGGRTLEMVAGDLTLLDRETLAKMRAELQLESPASVGTRVNFAAGKFAAQAAVNNQMEKIVTQRNLDDAICQWAAIQRMKGRPDSEINRRFYQALKMSPLDALAQDKQSMLKLTDTVQRWYL